jgi:hypothetical protein
MTGFPLSIVINDTAFCHITFSTKTQPFFTVEGSARPPLFLPCSAKKTNIFDNSNFFQQITAKKIIPKNN